MLETRKRTAEGVSPPCPPVTSISQRRQSSCIIISVYELIRNWRALRRLFHALWSIEKSWEIACLFLGSGERQTGAVLCQRKFSKKLRRRRRILSQGCYYGAKEEWVNLIQCQPSLGAWWKKNYGSDMTGDFEIWQYFAKALSERNRRIYLSGYRCDKVAICKITSWSYRWSTDGSIWKKLNCRGPQPVLMTIREEYSSRVFLAWPRPAEKRTKSMNWLKAQTGHREERCTSRKLVQICQCPGRWCNKNGCAPS